MMGMKEIADQLKRGATAVKDQIAEAAAAEPRKSSTMPRLYIREGSKMPQQYIQTVHGNFMRRDLLRMPGKNRTEKKQFILQRRLRRAQALG